MVCVVVVFACLLCLVFGDWLAVCWLVGCLLYFVFRIICRLDFGLVGVFTSAVCWMFAGGL